MVAYPRVPPPPKRASIPAIEADQLRRLRQLERALPDARASDPGDLVFEGTFDGSDWSDTVGATVDDGQLVPDHPGNPCMVVARWTVYGPPSGDPVEWSGSVYGLDGTGDVRGETGPRDIKAGTVPAISAHYLGLVAGPPAGVTVEGSGSLDWICRVRGHRVATPS